MKRLLIPLFAIFAYLSTAQHVFAIDMGGVARRTLRSSGCLTEGNVATLACTIPLMVNIIYWMLFFSGITALFLLIIGGFKYMTSGGEAQNVDSAKKTLTWAVVGLLVIFASFAILGFIASTLDLGCLNRFGFTNCGDDLGGTGGGGGVRPRFF